MCIIVPARVRLDAERAAALRSAPGAGVNDVGEQRHPLHAPQAERPLPRVLRRHRLAAGAAAAGGRRGLPRPLVPLLILLMFTSLNTYYSLSGYYTQLLKENKARPSSS